MKWTNKSQTQKPTPVKTPEVDLAWLEPYKKSDYHDQNSLLEVVVDYLDVVGSGKNQKEAFANAFAKLKTQIYQKHHNFIIHLEPLDVIRITDSSNLKVKKFFGFLPRRVLNWEATLRIVYQVKFISEVS